MTLLDGQDLFGSGPSAIQGGGWERSLDRRGFPGVDGELILDHGLRSRTLVQTGRLQAVSASALHTLLHQVESFLDGQSHSLTDNHGQSYSRVVLERFEPTTPVRFGRGFWCEYQIVYRQLP